MRKFMLVVALMAFLAVPAMAEVDVKSEGSKVTTAVAVDFYGPTVAKVGGVATVDMTALTGPIDVTGNIATTGTFTSSNDSTLGWMVVTGSNTFGTTTCTNACVVCVDAGATANALVACNVATADSCLCAGGN